MQHVSGIEDKAKAARKKKAVYGTDVDLESYESEAKPQEIMADAGDLPSVVRKAALDVGVKLDSESSGATASTMYGNSLAGATEALYSATFLALAEWSTP